MRKTYTCTYCFKKYTMKSTLTNKTCIEPEPPKKKKKLSPFYTSISAFL